MSTSKGRPANAPGERAIQFVLDGRVHQVENLSPTLTLLEYLRDHLGRTGTKEGCAEGDCGACTVVVAERNQASVQYRSLNACIAFLPTLDGKVLFTVESLEKLSGGGLHPVQQVLVNNHASQCGFCTPGFVMTLFALSESGDTFSDQQVRESLAGNLCRCTGYRPILAAAQELFDSEYQTTEVRSRQNDREERENEITRQLDQIAVKADKHLSCSSSIQTREQNYFAPVSVDSLLKQLQKIPTATLLAGGTDIGLWVTKQGRSLDQIIYIGNVQELSSIRRGDSEFEIPAAVSLTDAFEVLLDEYPELSEILTRFASPGICNAGTLCGNVANGSPIGDTMPCLMALGASVKLCDMNGERLLALEDFYLSYQKKDLKPGEIVYSVVVPRRSGSLNFRAYKIAKRFDQDISSVLGAFAVELEQGKIKNVRICYGGMAEVPLRATDAENALKGLPWEASLVDSVAATLSKDLQPISDMRASAGYRSQIAGNLLRRFFLDVSQPDGSVQSPVTIWDGSYSDNEVSRSGKP